MTISKIKSVLSNHGVSFVMFAYDLYAVDQYTNSFKLVKATHWTIDDLRDFLNY